jgi:hypothetical protein
MGDFTTVQDSDAVAQVQTSSQIMCDHKDRPALFLFASEQIIQQSCSILV